MAAGEHSAETSIDKDPDRHPRAGLFDLARDGLSARVVAGRPADQRWRSEHLYSRRPHLRRSAEIQRNIAPAASSTWVRR